MTGASAALAIGINYTGTDNQLQGCVNDAKALVLYYVQHGLVKEEDARVLVEPTGFQIIEAIRALARRSHVDGLERVYLSYSGHGSQVPDANGDEIDRTDECVCPSDFQKKGVIIDDQIRALLAEFNPNTIVSFLCDSCHSGSMADLPIVYSGTVGVVKAQPMPAKCMMISGCLDTQTSADAFDAETGTFTGAMTSALLTVLKTFDNADVFKVVSEMRKVLRERGFPQRPLLSASYTIKRATPFLL